MNLFPEFRAVAVLSLLALGACAQKATYVKNCEAATFTASQCDFLYSKRDIRVGVSGPLIGGIVGINLP